MQDGAQLPDSVLTSKPRSGARDLLSQLHQQEAASMPHSPTSHNLADQADVMALTAPMGLQQKQAWLKMQSARLLAQADQRASQSDLPRADMSAAWEQAPSPGQVQSKARDLQSKLRQAGSGLQSVRSDKLQTRLSGLQPQGSGGQLQPGQSALQSSGSGQLQSGTQSLGSGHLQTGQSMSQSSGSGHLQTGQLQAGQQYSGQLQAGELQSGQLDHPLRQQLARQDAVQTAEQQVWDQQKAVKEQQPLQHIQQHSHQPAASGLASQAEGSNMPISMAQQPLHAGLSAQMPRLATLQQPQHRLTGTQLPGIVGHSHARPDVTPGTAPANDLGDPPEAMPGSGISGDTSAFANRRSSSSTAANLEAQHRAMAMFAGRDTQSGSWGHVEFPNASVQSSIRASASPRQLDAPRITKSWSRNSSPEQLLSPGMPSSSQTASLALTTGQMLHPGSASFASARGQPITLALTSGTQAANPTTPPSQPRYT